MSATAATPLVPGLILAGPGWFKGITVAETAGLAATVKLFDNASAGSGTLLGTYRLNGAAANASIDVLFAGEKGVRFAAGVFAVITGTVEGSIRT